MKRDIIDELSYLERQNLAVIIRKSKLLGEEVVLRIANISGELEFSIYKDENNEEE